MEKEERGSGRKRELARGRGHLQPGTCTQRPAGLAAAPSPTTTSPWPLSPAASAAAPSGPSAPVSSRSVRSLSLLLRPSLLRSRSLSRSRLLSPPLPSLPLGEPAAFLPPPTGRYPPPPAPPIRACTRAREYLRQLFETHESVGGGCCSYRRPSRASAPRSVHVAQCGCPRIVEVRSPLAPAPRRLPRYAPAPT